MCAEAPAVDVEVVSRGPLYRFTLLERWEPVLHSGELHAVPGAQPGGRIRGRAGSGRRDGLPRPEGRGGSGYAGPGIRRTVQRRAQDGLGLTLREGGGSRRHSRFAYDHPTGRAPSLFEVAYTLRARPSTRSVVEGRAACGVDRRSPRHGSGARASAYAEADSALEQRIDGLRPRTISGRRASVDACSTRRSPAVVEGPAPVDRASGTSSS